MIRDVTRLWIAQDHPECLRRFGFYIINNWDEYRGHAGVDREFNPQSVAHVIHIRLGLAFCRGGVIQGHPVVGDILVDVNQLPFLTYEIVNGSHGRLVWLFGWLFRLISTFIAVSVTFRLFVAIALFTAILAITAFFLLLAKRPIKEYEAHQRRVFIHRLGGDGYPGEFIVVCGRDHFPLTNVLGKHPLHYLRQLGQDLGIRLRIVNPAVCGADGDRTRIVKRANPAHLHEGDLAIFRHGKFRRSEFKRGVIIPDA